MITELLEISSMYGDLIGKGIASIGKLGLEVPAFAAAIEAHQKRITEAIINRALELAAEKNVSFC